MSDSDDLTPKDELAITIGRNARRARLALDLTQEAVAKRMDKSAEFYARIERGNALPSVRTLRAMCDALEITADELLGVDPNAGPRAMHSVFADLPRARVRLVRRVIKLRPILRRAITLLLKAYDEPDNDPA